MGLNCMLMSALFKHPCYTALQSLLAEVDPLDSQHWTLTRSKDEVQSASEVFTVHMGLTSDP